MERNGILISKNPIQRVMRAIKVIKRIMTNMIRLVSFQVSKIKPGSGFILIVNNTCLVF